MFCPYLMFEFSHHYQSRLNGSHSEYTTMKSSHGPLTAVSRGYLPHSCFFLVWEMQTSNPLISSSGHPASDRLQPTSRDVCRRW